MSFFTIVMAEVNFHARPEAVKQSGGIRGSFGRILFLLPQQKSMKIRSLQSENRDSLSVRSSTLRRAVLRALKGPHSDQKRGDTDGSTH